MGEFWASILASEIVGHLISFMKDRLRGPLAKRQRMSALERVYDRALKYVISTCGQALGIEQRDGLARVLQDRVGAQPRDDLIGIALAQTPAPEWLITALDSSYYRLLGLETKAVVRALLDGLERAATEEQSDPGSPLRDWIAAKRQSDVGKRCQ